MKVICIDRKRDQGSPKGITSRDPYKSVRIHSVMGEVTSTFIICPCKTLKASLMDENTM